MAAPQRRPRDSRATNAADLAAKSFQQSNQTMTMFLGGTQKDWMTGHPVTNDNSTSHSNISRNDNFQRPDNVNHQKDNVPPSRMVAKTGRNQPNHGSGTTSHPEPGPSSTSLRASSRPYISERTTTDTQERMDSVLPSPAPSDEHPQEIAYMTESGEGNGANTNGSGGNPLSEAPHGTRLIELAERYGGVEQLEKRLQDAESPNLLPDQLVSSSNLSSGDADPRPIAATRAKESEIGSSTRAQFMPRATFVDSHQNLPSTTTCSGDDSLPDSPYRVPSKEETAGFLRETARRLENIKFTQSGKDQVQGSRLGLLQEACNCHDYFYLIAHQLYCLQSHLVTSKTFTSLPLSLVHAGGLMLLSYLLLPNDQIESSAVAWFSTFPLTLEKLLERWPGLRITYEKVLTCLSNIGLPWPILQNSCRRRFYPPTVDELVHILGVDSFVLQRVINRAIVREIWPKAHDECYGKAESIFLRNQHDVLARASFVGTPRAATRESILSYNQQLAQEYLTLASIYKIQTQSSAQRQAQLSPTQGPMQQIMQSSGQAQSNIHRHQHVLPSNDTAMAPPQQIFRSGPPGRTASLPHIFPHNTQNAPFLRINTQPTPRNPLHLVNTLSLPSSPASSTFMSPITTTRIPNVHNVQTSPISNSAVSVQPRRRGRSRRDQTSIVIPSSSTRRLSAEHQNRRGDEQAWSNLTHSHASEHSPSQIHDGNSVNRTPMNNDVLHSNLFSPATPVFRDANGSYFSIAQNHSQPRSGSYGTQSPSPMQAGFSHHDPSNVRNMQGGTREFWAQPQSNTGLLPQIPISQQLIPPSGYFHSYSDPQNSILATLHQVEVRSPTMALVSTDRSQDANVTSFAIVKSVAVMPAQLSAKKRHFTWRFDVTKVDFDSLAQDANTTDGSPPHRTVGIGSVLYRVRCIDVTSLKAATESDWVVAETIWPKGVAVLLNGIALEIRRKSHYGKDLPIDITKHMKEGNNVLSIAMTCPKQQDKTIYSVGTEMVQITNSYKVREDISSLEEADAMKRIEEHLTSVDPEIQIVNSAVVLDVTDPFTSRIYETPVRGKTCRHHQCFDLNVFLQTRGSNSANQPSTPEQFKCPICGADARPKSLVVDLFFVKVRRELEKMNRLDVKAIIMGEQGKWTIKEEEECGDGHGQAASPADKLAAARVGKAPTRVDNEIIELDDE